MTIANLPIMCPSQINQSATETTVLYIAISIDPYPLQRLANQRRGRSIFGTSTRKHGKASEKNVFEKNHETYQQTLVFFQHLFSEEGGGQNLVLCKFLLLW